MEGSTEVVSARTIFIARSGAPTISVIGASPLGRGRATLSGPDVYRMASVRHSRRTGPNAHVTHRSHCLHLQRTQRINLIQEKRTRTGETLNSNLDGNHD